MLDCSDDAPRRRYSDEERMERERVFNLCKQIRLLENEIKKNKASHDVISLISESPLS